MNTNLINQNNELPNSVLNSAFRTKQLVYWTMLIMKGTLNDPYIQKNRSKSILCYPIFNQNKNTWVFIWRIKRLTYLLKIAFIFFKSTLYKIAISIENTKFIKKLDETRKKSRRSKHGQIKLHCKYQSRDSNSHEWYHGDEISSRKQQI